MGFVSWLKELFNPEPNAGLPMYSNGNPAKYDLDAAPPAYTAGPSAPVSQLSAGFSRVSFQRTPGFPSQAIVGPPPCFDHDNSPVFLGSAHFSDGSIHPCKIAPALSPSVCRVPYGGRELEFSGPYDLLPFNPETMEFVPAAHGHIPKGRRAIEGGHEKNKDVKLYHAVAQIRLGGGKVVRVPGKTAPQLSGCNVAWGGEEKVLRTNYEILCWKEGFSPQDGKSAAAIHKT
ncbi:hypothetical protein D9757_007090 [Collybiopsis confluens]|uniref:Uncharacterized protein n=1 Tax=Collybiopsis confluens TaxID=2823264 RepID=A0A8H5HCM8_9AGAR|nr:hypothetical protein D9757_007090 [Collybiopsis confluens]